MSGFPVVVVESGGVPVTQVQSGAPVMTVSEHGGVAITLTENAAPFVVLNLDGTPYTGYEPEADALFARMTTAPDETRKGLINDLIIALKAGGSWAKYDGLHVIAAHNAQAASLNWIEDAYPLTPVNSPTFTADRGYAGNGSTSYLEFTGYNPAAAPKHVQNSCHIGAWQRTASLAADAGIGSDGNHNVNLRQTVGKVRLFSSVSLAQAQTGSVGHVVGRRNASVQEMFKNGVTLASNAPTNAAIGTALRLGLVGGIYTTQQFAISHMGADLTAGEILAAYNAFNTYLTAIGAA